MASPAYGTGEGEPVFLVIDSHSGSICTICVAFPKRYLLMSRTCSGLSVCGFVLLMFVVVGCRDTYDTYVDNAIKDYTEAIRLDPENVSAYTNRGFSWANKNEHDKAIEDYNEAIRLDPEYAKAYYYRGRTWNLKGELDKAIKDFNEAIRLDPEYANAYQYRSQVWQKKGDSAKAAKDVAKYHSFYTAKIEKAKHTQTQAK
jgi:tetratricopeptide (TPR) repeat protein